MITRSLATGKIFGTARNNDVHMKYSISYYLSETDVEILHTPELCSGVIDYRLDFGGHLR